MCNVHGHRFLPYTVYGSYLYQILIVMVRFRTWKQKGGLQDQIVPVQEIYKDSKLQDSGARGNRGTGGNGDKKYLQYMHFYSYTSMTNGWD